MKRMIDLHMHIIPDVDDGSISLEMSEKMIRMAIEQGVEVIFATSHSFAHEHFTEHVRTQYRKLHKMIEDKELPVKLCFGCEVALDADHIEQILNDLEVGRIPSLNMTKYVLVELYDDTEEDCIYSIGKLVAKGWLPIIAHAERIDKFSIGFVKELKSLGCLIQMNAYSISEERNMDIKENALILLNEKLVDFVGSDAHRLEHRAPKVKSGIDFLYDNFEKEYVDDILYNNAYNLLLTKNEKVEEQSSNLWIDGMMGLVIGDALGTPVQFLSREDVKEAPIFTMDGFGTYDMPAGAWSDDSSMAIATLDSICNKKRLDYDDIMECFYKWTANGIYTPTGMAFDQGNTCMEAIINYARERNYKTCGKIGEYANGNGALMRIMPVCLFEYIQYKNGLVSVEEAVEAVHQATALTHNHLRAKMASGIYFFMVQAILEEEGSLMQKLQSGMKNAKAFYKSDITNLVEWSRFGRLDNLTEFSTVPEENIKSSGYVLDSLEAAVWSLITAQSFEEGLLKAVNLGDDTDTVGAIAGGLAGLHYGYSGMPRSWRREIIKSDELIELCNTAEGEFYVQEKK